MARRRRGRKRAPLTPQARFWMRVVGGLLTVVGIAVTLFFCITLWNNIYALIFTILVLFLLSGLPLLQAYHRRGRPRQGRVAPAEPAHRV